MREAPAVGDGAGGMDPLFLGGGGDALGFVEVPGFAGAVVEEAVRADHQRGVVGELPAVDPAVEADVVPEEAVLVLERLASPRVKALGGLQILFILGELMKPQRGSPSFE